jgi:valyl-tRNA synthetase
LVQFSLTTAPIIPFITEYFWQKLVVDIDSSKEESIHLAYYPDKKEFNEKIATEDFVQQL